MSQRHWCSHVLFDPSIPTAEIANVCRDWIKRAKFIVEGYGSEPLDTYSYDEGDDSAELRAMRRFDAIVNTLRQNPGLGTILVSANMKSSQHRAFLSITFRDIYGIPANTNYCVTSMNIKEFNQLDTQTFNLYWKFHLSLIDTLSSVTWMTVGEKRDYFPQLLADPKMLAEWQSGKGLIPLEYTWIRTDFYEKISSFLPHEINPSPSPRTGDGNKLAFVRLHSIEPI